MRVLWLTLCPSLVACGGTLASYPNQGFVAGAPGGALEVLAVAAFFPSDRTSAEVLLGTDPAACGRRVAHGTPGPESRQLDIVFGRVDGPAGAGVYRTGNDGVTAHATYSRFDLDGDAVETWHDSLVLVNVVEDDPTSLRGTFELALVEGESQAHVTGSFDAVLCAAPSTSTSSGDLR